MRHLFIINPVCAKIKGKTDTLMNEIHTVMKKFPEQQYDIHVTRWHRDALGFCRKHVSGGNGETIRVHIMGGNSTLFEIVNAVIDLENAQIACYPMGISNMFLHYYGKKNYPLFRSVENQVKAETVSIDALRCNHNYGVSNVLTGMEAYVDNMGDRFIERTHLPNDLGYLLVAFPRLFSKLRKQNYRIIMDGKNLDGEYLSVMAANHPFYSVNMHPAIDARTDSGMMDAYLVKDSPFIKRLVVTQRYLYGKYDKYPDYLLHYTCKKINISSDELMWLSVDGETFYGNKFEYEILPGAIQFANPLKDTEKEGVVK